MRLEAGSEPIPGVRLVQLRGRGGFAEVWEATGPDDARLAVKFMASRNATSSAKETRIIQAIQKLRHPNLLRLDRVWSIPNYIVMAMELADGSLFDLIDAYMEEYRTPLAATLVVGYLRQAATGLDFLNAHRHTFDGRKVGFQHCDVKPSNLLLVGEQVKLADFGLCTATGTLNPQGVRAGTLEFAAPEVHRGALADSSDQYSLAVTYYYLRTGQLPFPTPKTGFRRENSYHRPAADLGLVDRDERRALERALDLQPVNRWPNCVAMLTALARAVGGPNTDSSSELAAYAGDQTVSVRG